MAAAFANDFGIIMACIVFIGYFMFFACRACRACRAEGFPHSMPVAVSIFSLQCFLSLFTQVLRSCADFLIPRLMGFDEMLIANTAPAMEEQQQE